MTLEANDAAIPGLSRKQHDEAMATGFTHFRHAEGDLIRSLAILRAAALIMADLVLAKPAADAALEGMNDDLRHDALQLIGSARDAEEI